MNKVNMGILAVVVATTMAIIIAKSSGSSNTPSELNPTTEVVLNSDTDAVVTETVVNSDSTDEVDVKETAGCSYNAYSDTWSSCEATDKPGVCMQSRTSVPAEQQVNDNGTAIECAVGTQTRACPCPEAAAPVAPVVEEKTVVEALPEDQTEE